MIRTCNSKDYEQIYELGNILHDEYKKLYNLEELCRKEYFHLLVFEENNSIIGFINYTYLDNVIDIVDIVVKEDKRRNKVASQLLNRMISSSKPGDKILLEVNVNNIPALSLYKKFGFEIIHTRKKYYKDEDAYLMERVNENE